MFPMTAKITMTEGAYRRSLGPTFGIKRMASSH